MGGDPSEVLNPSEHALDGVAVSIEHGNSGDTIRNRKRLDASQTTTLTYNARNWVLSKTPPASGPVVSYTYDPLGRVLTVSDTSAAITSVANPPSTTGLGIAIWHNYDELNRRTESIWDSVNAQATPTWATATFDHAYNKVNQRIYQAVDDNSFWHYPPARP